MAGKEEMVVTRKRRKFSAEDKVRILKRHLVDRVTVSDLCDEYGLNPNLFYRWQKEFFEKGHAAFLRGSDAATKKLEREVGALKDKLGHKDEVIAEIIVQRAREKFPEARGRAITDNGPQFIARDFKEFIRVSGMTHVRTSPFYPQSNGKVEAWHKSLKKECIRPQTPLDHSEARRGVGEFVEHYNNERLHSALCYVAPADKLEGRDREIFNERDLKLERARKERRQRRREIRQAQVDGAGSAGR